MTRYFSTILVLSLTLSFPMLGHAALHDNEAFKFWQMIDRQDLSLEEVMHAPASEWQALNNNVSKSHFLDEGYWQASQGTIMWVKIKLPRRINTSRIWLELIPNVGLDGQMAIKENDRWHWQLPVGLQNHKSDFLPATFLTFIIDTPRDHKVAYLKLQTSQIFHFRIQVKTEEQQINSLLKDHLFNGFILGFLLLAMIYNLAIGTSAGEKMYLYYAFYVFCIGLYVGVACGYLRLTFPGWGADAIFSHLTILLAIFSGTLFIRELLDTAMQTPKIDLLLRIQQTALFISIILIGIVSDTFAYALIEFASIIVPAILLLAGYTAYRNKHPLALYFLIAWSLFLICATIWAWMWLGIIPADIKVLRLFLTGCVMEVILLSFVLGYRYSVLKRQTESLTDAKLKYQILSETDFLTGIFNRRGFIQQVDKLMCADRSECVWLSIDIDHFKSFNDQYGHIAGDKLLTAFGDMLSVKVRREDLAAKLIEPTTKSSYRRGVAGRVGGEEFAIFLINCSLPHARLYAERLLRDFERLKIKHTNDMEVGSTISIGAAILSPHDTLETVWKRADKLLYKAKNQGRNKVVQERPIT